MFSLRLQPQHGFNEGTNRSFPRVSPSACASSVQVFVNGASWAMETVQGSSLKPMFHIYISNASAVGSSVRALMPSGRIEV